MNENHENRISEEGEVNRKAWPADPKAIAFVKHEVVALTTQGLREQEAKRRKEMREAGLARFRIVAQRCQMPANLIESADLRVGATNDMIDELTYQLAIEVASGTRTQHVTGTVEVPTNWYQALKRALGWKWKKERIATHTTVYRVCPHVSTEDLYEHLLFLQGRHGQGEASYASLDHVITEMNKRIQNG